MSRDLSFWKYKDIAAARHYEVYQKLSNGEEVSGVSMLPIEEILQVIQTRLKGWDRIDKYHLKKDNEILEIFTTAQFVRFDCYSIVEENMNKLIDIMLEFDCKLYDSAIDVRFD